MKKLKRQKMVFLGFSPFFFGKILIRRGLVKMGFLGGPLLVFKAKKRRINAKKMKKGGEKCVPPPNFE